MQPPQVQKGVIFELSQANVEEWQLELFLCILRGLSWMRDAADTSITTFNQLHIYDCPMSGLAKKMP